MGADGSFEVKRLGSDGHFALVGELDMASAERLREAVTAADGRGDVILDISQLTFVDSSGIHVFIELACNMAGERSSVILRSPSPIARRTLEIVGAAGFPGVEIEDSAPT
jgi:anti-sigma B factor antagonist